MTIRRRLGAPALLILALAAPAAAQTAPPESIESLTAFIQDHPADTDTAIRLATLLLREGRVDESASTLQTVLQRSPDNSDALLIMALVHLRRGDAAAAEETSARGLAVAPFRADLRLAHARALRSLDRRTEAIADVRRVLFREPSNEEATDLLRALEASPPQFWETQASFTHDSFDDDREPWREFSASLKRSFTRGSVIGRLSSAKRFGLTDQQYEVDAYPSFHKGTYAYVNAGFSPHGRLYPDYRAGAELYHSLGNGVELSFGYRRLGFGDAVNIYTPSATYYFGNSLLTFRMFITPREPAASRSYHLTYRHYFGDGTEYIGVRGGTGATREIRDVTDLLVLDSNVFAIDAVKHLGRYFGVNGGLVYSREQRVFNGDVRQTTLSIALAARF